MKRPCRWPRCPEVIETTYCAKHQREVQRQDVKRRGNERERGYDAKHRLWAKWVLAVCPYCANPYRNHGPNVRSVIADHIVPIRQGGRWTLSNGQGLCRSCHGIKTHEERRVFV